ncbi:RimJ/RimL family protein N-acetyltransferase [Paenibacillus sp. BK033]|uniref:GNAT family N-acetyltransferase n=1 Tax=Paenibacillus sp. BK033 TaxID=2512133 RepID=UPI001051CAE9|nr:GNAT family protein [Paenibacillus sp. BK033]TCM92673.1 RimJ/RimL family protein N-acetyltransferase [Paenibacillus sp. BK033]
MRFRTNLTLENRKVILLPLQAAHVKELARLLSDPRVWEMTWRRNNMEQAIELALESALVNREAGTQLPFAIMDKTSGRVAGTTRLGDLDVNNRNVEIGWTWMAPSFWGQGINQACKLLLLQYCFEELGVIRVQFSASGRNLRSQRALEKIGAVREGVLRRHRVDATDGGTVHDNVFYSILEEEWPLVRERLLRKMNPF